MNFFFFPLAQSTPSPYDHLRQASLGRDVDSVIKGGPVSEERLVAVGEGPMIGIYRITKVGGRDQNCHVTIT